MSAKPFEVHNLATGETRVYTDITPEEAVVASFAQEHKNWSTWTYAALYGKRVRHGKKTVSCGDWTTKKETR